MVPKTSQLWGPSKGWGVQTSPKGSRGHLSLPSPNLEGVKAVETHDLMAVQGWDSRCSGDPSISFYSSVSLLKKQIIMDPELT